jgi:hypothetical protein
MAMRLARLTAVLIATAPAAGGAGTQAVSTAPSRPATLAQVAWITGHWVDDSGGSLSEEIWAEPVGDSMIGMWRYVSKGKAQIFELLSITEEAGGPVFRLRHFDPRMVAREEKEKPLIFPLVSLKEREAVFEGQEEGVGTVRLTYRRPTAGTLRVTLDKQGKSQEFRFRLKTS